MKFNVPSQTWMVAPVICCLLEPGWVGAGEDKGKTPQYPRVNNATCYVVDANWPEQSNQLPTGHVPGVAVDPDDNVVVFVRAKPPVRIYSPQGKLLRAWGDDHIGSAHHLKVDSGGNIWVADIGLHVVRQFSPNGRVLLTIGTPGISGVDSTHLDKPTDMAVTKHGDVFVADGYGNNRIVHFDRMGRYIKEWGRLGAGVGEFSIPHAIAIDSKGLLYVADRNNARVQVFQQSGKCVAQWKDLIVPWGFWVTKTDDIWICGCSPMAWHDNKEEPLSCPPKDQLFMRFDPSGRLRQLWTVPKTTVDGQEKPGELNWVHCLAVDSLGSIYAGDIMGKRIQKFIRQK